MPKAVLIDSFFSHIFRFFFSRKTGKSGTTGNISEVWKFNKGQIFWKASHSNIWGKKMENMETQKIARQKTLKFKHSYSIRTALTLIPSNCSSL